MHDFIVNKQILKDLGDISEEKYLSYVRRFLDAALKTLSKFYDSCAARNKQEMLFFTHDLKGEALNWGLRSVADRIIALEGVVKRDEYVKINEELQRVTQEIASLKNEVS